MSAALVAWFGGLLAIASDRESELLSALPMAGRATPHSIDLTLHAGDREIEVAVELTAVADAQSVARPVRFGASERLGPPYDGVRARAELAPSQGEGAATLRVPARGYAEITLAGLAEGAEYRWQLAASEADPVDRRGAAVRRESFDGRFVTVRPRGSEFRFGVFSDCHVFPRTLEPELVPEIVSSEPFVQGACDAIGWYRRTRERVASECGYAFLRMDLERLDFTVSLGDTFDLHGRGFNASLDSPQMAAAAHGEARAALAKLAGAGALYEILGNWEGESGCHPPEHRAFALAARKRFSVNPRPATSELGGSADEDYYAWRWGDVLCVALDVRGFTLKPHHLGGDGDAEGRPDEFTLGAAQKEFLEKTLAGSDLPYELIFIHHPVGGDAGDPQNSAYGRGGGRAAHVGEQAWVHDLCVKHGVQIFFYGHDHVFTDMVVDGVHYSLPGTTSAPWRFKAEETGYEQFWPQSGYARVQVTPERLHVDFVDLRGEVLHAFDVAPRAATQR